MTQSRHHLIQQHFDDVAELRDEDTGFGALSGTGANEHYTARPAAHPEGTAYQVKCDNCGRSNVVLLEWRELIIAMHGRVPPGWKVGRGRMYPNVGCRECNYVCAVQITPDEAQKQVHQGLQGGRLSRQAFDQMASQLRGQRG